MSEYGQNGSAAGASSRDNGAGDISALDIIVAVPPDQHGDMLARELSRTRGSVRRIWPLPDRLPASAGVMFCELAPELPQCMPWVPGKPLAALVVVVNAIGAPQLKLLRDCAPLSASRRTVSGATVLTSLAVGRAQFLYEQRLRARIDKLDETLRSFRSVERAKGILMDKRRLDEEQAYHFIRRQAMSQRVSVAAVAAAIIDSNDILG